MKKYCIYGLIIMGYSFSQLNAMSRGLIKPIGSRVALKPIPSLTETMFTTTPLAVESQRNFALNFGNIRKSVQKFSDTQFGNRPTEELRGTIADMATKKGDLGSAARFAGPSTNPMINEASKLYYRNMPLNDPRRIEYETSELIRKGLNGIDQAVYTGKSFAEKMKGISAAKENFDQLPNEEDKKTFLKNMEDKFSSQQKEEYSKISGLFEKMSFNEKFYIGTLILLGVHSLYLINYIQKMKKRHKDFEERKNQDDIYLINLIKSSINDYDYNLVQELRYAKEQEEKSARKKDENSKNDRNYLWNNNEKKSQTNEESIIDENTKIRKTQLIGANAFKQTQLDIFDSLPELVKEKNAELIKMKARRINREIENNRHFLRD